jgi:hypothetical protein
MHERLVICGIWVARKGRKGKLRIAPRAQTLIPMEEHTGEREKSLFDELFGYIMDEERKSKQSN